jgi:hypothetical protein
MSTARLEVRERSGCGSAAALAPSGAPRPIPARAVTEIVVRLAVTFMPRSDHDAGRRPGGDAGQVSVLSGTAPAPVVASPPQELVTVPARAVTSVVGARR